MKKKQIVGVCLSLYMGLSSVPIQAKTQLNYPNVQAQSDIKQNGVVYSGGKYYVYKNGAKDTSFNGLAPLENGTWLFFKAGEHQTSYSGGAKKNNGDVKYYRVKNGKLDNSFTGYGYCLDGNRRYFKNGVEASAPVVSKTSTQSSSNTQTKPTNTTSTPTAIQQSNLNGVKTVNGKRAYYRAGQVDASFTGLAKDSVDGKWYFFRKGNFERFTGTAKSVTNGKYYVARNGVLDWGFTGVAKCIDDGKYHFVRKGLQGERFTGWSKSIENGDWYFTRNGILDWSFTGVAKSVENGKWYHGKNGHLDWNFTGFSKSVENGKWYFSRKGALDWSFTGIAKSIENGKWYFAKKGVLDWSFTGDAKSVVNGKTYRVEKGRVNFKYHGVKSQGADNPNVKIYKNGMLWATVRLAWQKEYGNGWGSNGCAPTSIANAVNIANGNRNQNVNTVGRHGMNWGLISGPGGSGWLTNMGGSAGFVSRVFGLKTKQVNTKAELLNELDAGHTVLLQARTGYDGNYNESTILHAQLAIAREGNTIYIAESNAKRLGVAPHVRTVNIDRLFSHKVGGAWLSIYK